MQETHEQKLHRKRMEGSTDFLIPFEKMHGLGNDFVIIDYRHLPWETSNPKDLKDKNIKEEQSLTRAICDRHYGVGADGLIIIYPVIASEEAINSWRYYNADGSIGEMCGNGIRCAAKYIYEHGLSQEETMFKIETLAGDISVELLEDEMVKVGMGAARELKKDLRHLVKYSDNALTLPYDYVSMGNPHAVFFFNKSSSEQLKDFSKLGPEIEIHKDFPNKTNVEFARVTSPTNIELIVWERGCGFTKACGTGACATVVAAISRGFAKADTDVTVTLPGGDLIIRIDSVAENIFMTGKAELVFSGNYNHKIQRGHI